VNSPLISRSTMFRTEALAPAEVAEMVTRAAEDPMRGLGGVAIDDDALEALSERVGGDARLAMNALEVAATLAEGRSRDSITLDDATEALQRRVIRYDKGGDRHYDVISAFIKSMRGSDVDATLYWLHTMIEAGEDPKFIARRMVILASEDVGLADSRALGIAVDAFRAVEVIGLPEGGYALTHAALYLATAPKSNSLARAIGDAREAVEQTPGADVPMHLRSAATSGERDVGIGVGYRYPHDDSVGVIAQQYLPDGIDSSLYQPGDAGDEAALADRLRVIDEILGKSR
jgi:putative ATPase